MVVVLQQQKFNAMGFSPDVQGNSHVETFKGFFLIVLPQEY